jgi:hypothetical protein
MDEVAESSDPPPPLLLYVQVAFSPAAEVSVSELRRSLKQRNVSVLRLKNAERLTESLEPVTE